MLNSAVVFSVPMALTMKWSWEMGQFWTTLSGLSGFYFSAPNPLSALSSMPLSWKLLPAKVPSTLKRWLKTLLECKHWNHHLDSHLHCKCLPNLGTLPAYSRHTRPLVLFIPPCPCPGLTPSHQSSHCILSSSFWVHVLIHSSSLLNLFSIFHPNYSFYEQHKLPH